MTCEPTPQPICASYVEMLIAFGEKVDTTLRRYRRQLRVANWRHSHQRSKLGIETFYEFTEGWMHDEFPMRSQLKLDTPNFPEKAPPRCPNRKRVAQVLDFNFCVSIHRPQVACKMHHEVIMNRTAQYCSTGMVRYILAPVSVDIDRVAISERLLWSRNAEDRTWPIPADQQCQQTR